MDYYCVNHTQEKAVGLCGTCERPACYKCSLNVNQTIFCSLECFNKLSPPSAPDIPAMRQEAAVSAVAVREAADLDEYSDVMAGLTDVSEVVVPASAADEPSVILKSDQALDPTTMLGMNPVAHGTHRDGSTLILIPGTRRAVMSSSCYFHPDTSAIVLCSKCRSPICSLCAKETPGGLTCSPDCGPPDPVGDLERRKFTLFNIGLGVAVLLVLIGGVVLLSAAMQPEPRITMISNSAAATEPVPAPVETKVESPAPVPAPTPEPVPETPKPEPVKIEKVAPPPVKLEPTPVKIETPKPEPPPPAVELTKPEPVATVVAVAAPPAPPPPPPPVVRELTALEMDLRWAASLLREAAPLLTEVTEAMHPEWKPAANLPSLAAKLTTVDIKLKQAREIYALRKKDAPDPTLLNRRIDAITEVLEGLQSGFDQIRERDRVLGKWRKRS